MDVLFVGAGPAGLGGAIRLAQLAKAAGKTLNVTILEKAKEVGPGLPVYPAATLVLAGSAAAHLPLTDDQPQVLSSTYHTNTSREYVATWYLEHLSPEFARQDSGPKKLPEALRNAHISDDDIAFVGERGDQIRVVELALDEIGTKITLLRSYTKPLATAPAQPPAQ